MTDFAHPEVLVDTARVQKHLTDPKLRVVEVDHDPAARGIPSMEIVETMRRWGGTTHLGA